MELEYTLLTKPANLGIMYVVCCLCVARCVVVCAAVSEASASPGNLGIVYVVYCLCVATCVAVSGVSAPLTKPGNLGIMYVVRWCVARCVSLCVAVSGASVSLMNPVHQRHSVSCLLSVCFVR